MFSKNRKIGVVIATALSVTIVVGAGLLVLPGLSFARAGRYGYIPWILVAIAMLPLLHIFAFFGKTYPSAGGVVGYVRSTLGARWATVGEVVILGTFSIGVPAIAIIGAQYLHQSFPICSAAMLAVVIVSLAFLAVMVGLRISGAIQTGIAALIVIGLLAIGFGFLSASAEAPVDMFPIPRGKQELNDILVAIPLVLFAFTGWEMTAFLAEDMENPRRDIPVSIWTSFIIVVALYLLLAWLIALYGDSAEQWRLAPVAQMARVWMGDVGALWVGVIAALLILANVVAAFFAVSRAVYSAGRDGVMPDVFKKLDRRGEPAVAITVTYVMFLAVIVFYDLGVVSVDVLLQLAGQNFFVLYLLASIGYFVFHKGNVLRRFVGFLAILFVVGMMCLFSVAGLIYCGALIASAWWLDQRAERRTDSLHVEAS